MKKYLKFSNRQNAMFIISLFISIVFVTACSSPAKKGEPEKELTWEDLQNRNLLLFFNFLNITVVRN